MPHLLLKSQPSFSVYSGVELICKLSGILLIGMGHSRQSFELCDDGLSLIDGLPPLFSNLLQVIHNLIQILDLASVSNFFQLVLSNRLLCNVEVDLKVVTLNGQLSDPLLVFLLLLIHKLVVICVLLPLPLQLALPLRPFIISQRVNHWYHLFGI